MELIYCNNTEHGTLRELSILMNVNAVFLHITVLYSLIYWSLTEYKSVQLH